MDHLRRRLLYISCGLARSRSGGTIEPLTCQLQGLNRGVGVAQGEQAEGSVAIARDMHRVGAAFRSRRTFDSVVPDTIGVTNRAPH